MQRTVIDYRNIPVQADIISGIIRLDMESNSCFRDLDSYVRSDQGVATLVLRVVNSPLYSRGRTIGTIPLAISVLGFNVVRSLAMLAFSRSLFANTRNPIFRIHLWQHSLLTALAGHAVCEGLDHVREQDEAFIAGLMHDMGKVLLFTHDPVRYELVLDEMLATGAASAEVERRLFGRDHWDVGREAAAEWKLPPRFGDYMGTDLAAPGDAALATPVLRSLAAANCLIAGIGIGTRAHPDLAARRAALNALGLTDEQCEPWLGEEFVAGLKENDAYRICAPI